MQGVLYLQSSYSMLKSLIPLKELVNFSLENKYKFIALTDESLHGFKELFDLTKDQPIKPVIGLPIEVIEPNQTNFLVYLKNKEGYENFLKLSSMKELGHKFNLYDLVTYQKGLIFVSSGFDSIINKTIIYGNELEAVNYLDQFNTLFDDFYVGVSSNHQIDLNVTLPFLSLNLKNQFKILPVHQTNYLLEEDKKVYETFIKIDNSKNELLTNEKRSFIKIDELNDIYNNYPKVKESLDNFLNSITFIYPKINFRMPKFDTPNNLSEKEYLSNLSLAGLKRRLQINDITNKDLVNKYIKRLEEELKVIDQVGFNDYFLIVYDFILYAKKNGVLVGPGRGSAAGSLVSYSLGITDVDPIKYNLMFERFLNPNRVTMPDIDIDFPDNKRDFVIDYVRNKYGNNHICSISTFSTLAVRSSVRDIARVLNVKQDRLVGIINAVLNNKVEESDLETKEVALIASKIEGLYRQTGTHAAGIILSDNDLTKSIPLQKGPFSFMQSQYDAQTLEELGLIKIDFLGIKNLAIIKEILENLLKRNIKIDLDRLNLEDEKTFKLLSSGDTTGIFQLESYGMRNVLQKLKPSNFEDIVATLALFRPGPMANIDIYIKRKEGAKFNYLHDDLKDILKSTYGIIIYQEQIMEIAKVFAGYSLFDADSLRAGISKKNLGILENERIKFIKGSIKKGYDKKLANDIFEYILKFADYGFNRSHSVSYSLVAYQMAYLKANHYLEFMRVLLNSVIGNENQTTIYLDELKQMGFKIYAPDLNLSTNKYLIYKGGVIMPLTQVKGIGLKTYESLLSRRGNQKFTSYNDIKERLKDDINQSQLSNLIYSGALDFLNLNRKTLIENISYETVLAEKIIKDYIFNIVSDYSFVDNQKYEKESLGYNVKFDILHVIKGLEKNNKKILLIDKLNLKNPGIYQTAGIIINKKLHITKKGSKMMFIELSDSKNQLDILVFDRLIESVTAIDKNKIIVITIKKDIYQGRDSYILESINEIL
ncbi:DNA polymerase III subunit alpha [Haploplasma modicum]|uniref:DNA polymerase III subunit alpha n=1 Tax=Haploplasma modicum TaxID=2150 RepID=UPI00214BD632|nr:DNA polymerase III subunit alpha [Haploplasma modicum]MCR1809292.1 DNA polymerase III subunit alpha [Haploplasma modicum]